MALRFAKLDADLDSNPKVRLGGRNAREVFAFILRQNAKLDRNGRLPLQYLDPEYLAYELMMPVGDARDGAERVVTAQLIRVHNDHISIAGWNDEWAKAPLEGAERTRRYRERQEQKAINPRASVPRRKAVTKAPSQNVTERHGDARDASEEIRGEEKREENTEEDSDPPAAVGFALVAPQHAGSPAPRARKPRSKAGRVWTAEEREIAARVLGKLSGRNQVQYTVCDEHVRLITARIEGGASEMDLRAVIGYCAADKLAGGLGWAGDDRMRQYLRPETLFGRENIARYLDPARTWANKLEVAS